MCAKFISSGLICLYNQLTNTVTQIKKEKQKKKKKGKNTKIAFVFKLVWCIYLSPHHTKPFLNTAIQTACEKVL